MPHSENHILHLVSAVDLEDLRSHMRVVELPHGRIIAESRQRVPLVYFPHAGILSCVVELESGQSIESGMIGNDGVFGASLALDSKVSLHKVIVQVPGSATVVTAEHVKAVAQSSPDFLALLMKYEQFLLGQVQQTTACNALHNVQQRMCKWLIRMHDLVGDELPLTQEFLAQMMGVRRPSVTENAVILQKEGLITYSRGKVKILSMDLVQKRACECAGAVRDLYVEMFETLPNKRGPSSKTDVPTL
jgi:CRP-like cAMP-binding protein